MSSLQFDTVGAVDNEESPTKAAKRETMEEAGIDIDIKGILSLEYNPVGIYDSQPNVYMGKSPVADAF